MQKHVILPNIYAIMHVMDLNWEDYRAVLHLVREKSLGAAAERLGCNYTTIARRIARAENALNQELFEKLPSGYQATELAYKVAEQAEKMEDASNNFLRYAASLEGDLSGSITITSPQLLVAYYISPVLKVFSQKHPNVEIKIRATNELLNLNRRDADLAVRITNEPDENLVGQKLTEQRTSIFATDKMASEIENDPDVPLNWIWFEHWDNVPEKALQSRSVANPKFIFDDMSAVIGAAQAGLGVVRLPLFLGRHTQGLRQVKLIEPQPYIDIWSLSHVDMKDAPKVRAFKDILIPYFKSKRSEFTAY